MERKKIGIMGGTFNPIHVGHLILAETAREQAKLDSILFMPSGKSYMKQEIDILSAEERLKLVELSVLGNPFFEVSDLEVMREGYTYTYETLEILTTRNKDTEYYFILGADSLYSIEKWKYPERIFDNCIILVGIRSDIKKQEIEQQINKLKQLYNARIILLDFPRIEISSTEIRKKVISGLSIRYLVEDKVEEYIYQKKLYMG